MSTKPPKQTDSDFGWKTGETIKADTYDALGNVRETGFAKLSDALYADPELRKRERASQLNKPLKSLKPGELVMEDSASGISEDYTPSNASKLIGKSKKFQGLDRFKNKDKK